LMLCDLDGFLTAIAIGQAHSSERMGSADLGR
jgi:hypothetical protein